MYLKNALTLPADFESLQLKDQDRKDLVAAFEDYNKLHRIYLGMQMFQNHSSGMIKLREQLCDARLRIGAIINLARRHTSATDSKYLF